MIHNSVKNQLTVSASEQTVELEVASVSMGDTLQVASIGLEEMRDGGAEKAAPRAPR